MTVMGFVGGDLVKGEPSKYNVLHVIVEGGREEGKEGRRASELIPLPLW